MMGSLSKASASAENGRWTGSRHRLAWGRALAVVLMLAFGIGVNHALAEPGADRQPSIECRVAKTTGLRAGNRARFTPGSRERYRLEYDSDARFDFTALFQGSESTQRKKPVGMKMVQAIRSKVTADLEVTALEAHENRFLLEFRLIAPTVSFTADGKPDPGIAQRMASDMAGPVFAELGPQGRVVGVHIPGGATNIAHGMLRTVLGITQFVTPPGDDFSSSWTSEEDDPEGTFHVEYRPLPAAGPASSILRLRKTRLKYSMPPLDQALPNTVPLPKDILARGHFDLSFDSRQHILVRMRGREMLTTKVASRKVGESRNDILLVHEKSDCAGGSAEALDNEIRAAQDAAYAPLYAGATSPAEREANMARSTLGADTADTVLAALDRLASGDKAGIDETALYLKIRSLIYLQPEVCDAMADRILHRKPDTAPFRLVVGALSAVGSDKAQAAMLRVLDAARDDVSETEYLLRAIAALNRPADAMLERLQALASQPEQADVALTAQLVLGVMARKLHAYNTERSDAVVGMFGERLRASKGTQERIHWLQVLGNAGTPAAAGLVEGYVADPAPEVRSIAMKSLRWQSDAHSEALLIAALQDDAEDEVRIAAARTLAFRPRNAKVYTALGKSMAADKSPAVRTTVMALIWRLQSEYPQARSLVRHAVRHDPDAGVREAAQKLLDENSGAP